MEAARSTPTAVHGRNERYVKAVADAAKKESRGCRIEEHTTIANTVDFTRRTTVSSAFYQGANRPSYSSGLPPDA